ncbi:MAG: bifunctional riboflavin kinase/FAD synthetase [Proteocatella sp.]
MTFLEYIEMIQVTGETVVTIGNFDGLHLGHMELIKKAVEVSRENNIQSIAFTYDIHPLSFLYSKAVHLLMSNEDKEQILIEKGIDRVLHVPFDEQIRNMTSQEFCDLILIKKLKTRHLVMGADAKFGKEKTEINQIKEYCEARGISVHIIPLLIMDEKRISSSNIRKLVEHGEIEKANKYLGRQFSIEGIVVHGKKLGRKIGYPTANLFIAGDKAVPSKGVYETIVELDGREYKGATNVGTNPTVGDKTLRVESYVIDFNGELYGKKIKVSFIRRLRNEIKFDSLEKLIEQMGEDVKNIIGNK